MTEKIGWHGEYKIRVVNKDTGKVTEEVKLNRVMNTVLDQLMGALQATSPNIEIKYLALGTSNAVVTDTQTQLSTELFRTPYIDRNVIGTGKIEHKFVVLSTEAVGTIEEIGIFGGTTASATANSGTLISRILWHKVKTNQEEIQFIRTDTIGRG